MRLKADKVVERTVGIVLPELHHGIGFAPRVRIAQSDRFHRPIAQRIKAASRHDLDRHAAFKYAAVVKAVNRRFAGGRQLLPERGVFLLGHWALSYREARNVLSISTESSDTIGATAS